jgi:N-acyl amino acid synthase of PEP-CTERM/exosortase system
MFFKYFEVSVVETKEELLASQRVRHTVYQKEKNWEAVSENARDECTLDRDSIHILVKSKTLNRHVGTIRLCINKSHNKLHFKEYFDDSEIDHSVADLTTKSNHVYCEVSRLSVIPAHRKKTSETSEDIGALERKLFKVCALALLASATIIFERLNLKAAVFLTEAKVARIGPREGFHFQRVGQDKELNGKRGLFVLRPEDLKQLKTGKSITSFLYRRLKNELALRQPLIPVGQYKKTSKPKLKKRNFDV